jgi:hypothetical protein
MARDSREGNAARRPAARAISVDQTTYVDAERNFRRGLTRPEQLRLAHEAATTRSAELRLAYPGLISVGSGFRTRRTAAGGQPVLTREPCVIFVVAKKWKTTGRPGDPRRLPSHLLAVAGPDGQRMLCAIPTDVRPLSQYGRPRPNAGGDDVPMPFGVLVRRTGDDALVRGVATCGVQRPGLPDVVFAMSCRHVLSRSLRDADGNQTGMPVLLNRPDLPRVGATLAARGALLDGPGFSFDAQLAKLSDGTELRRAMSGLKFTAADAFLHDPGDVGFGFWIATGRAEANGRRKFVWVDYTGTVEDFEMPYRLGNGSGIRVRHELVLHGISESQLMDGDSGSPAVRNQDGRQLMGMFIGGQGNEAFVLPAWQLMNPRNLGVGNELRWGVAPTA